VGTVLIRKNPNAKITARGVIAINKKQFFEENKELIKRITGR